MPIQDKSINGTDTLDSDNLRFIDTTVPMGELWYVGDFSIASDGSGSTQSARFEAGVCADLDVMNNITPNNASRGVRINIDTDTEAGTSGTIGAYATAGETVRMKSGPVSDGSTVGYFLEVRRVL